jgi:hypothetical protein
MEFFIGLRGTVRDPLFGDGSLYPRALYLADPTMRRASWAGYTVSAAAICMPAALPRWRSASHAA